MAEEESQKINDRIFRELIKRGYSLGGNTRIWNIADSKLWYLTPEQAQLFLDLEKSEKYGKNIIEKEMGLIKNNFTKMMKEVKEDNINIIDIGCGDGKKAALLIEKFSHNKKIRYCPIDISSYMVEKAITKIKELGIGEILELNWNISDFENLENVSVLLRDQNFKRNLNLLLGNTLGNFEINELLYGIRASMQGGDFLLIGNGLCNMSQEEILEPYKDKKQDEFLSKIMTQLGLKKDEIEYGVRFVNSRVEAFYTVKKDKRIRSQDKIVQFNKGDQIIVAVSYKYNKDDFTSFLELYFDDVIIKTSEDDSYALALCKK